MSVPGSYEYGPDWEAGELFGDPDELTAEDPDAVAGSDEEDVPPDPAIDERELLEPPS